MLEIFTLGITTGTTATTYDPASGVSRLQMAAFLSRTVDGALKRGSRRAALDRFWTPQSAAVLGITTVGAVPRYIKCDGSDIWVANNGSGTISRVRGSDGKLLETWTGAFDVYGIIVAAGMVVASSNASPGKLYRIDPSQTAGSVTTVVSTLPASGGLAFDGARFWTVNPGAVSIVTPGAAIPWTVTTVAGFTGPAAPIFDGNNIWVTDFTAAKLFKLDQAGVILQTVTLAGGNPEVPGFDGTNIWIPTNQPSVIVVRASSGAILATLTGNGMSGGSAFQAAFDGQRVAVTGSLSSDNVSLWKAADFSPLGSISPGAGTGPVGICSDGIHFWFALSGPGQLARF